MEKAERCILNQLARHLPFTTLCHTRGKAKREERAKAERTGVRMERAKAERTAAKERMEREEAVARVPPQHGASAQLPQKLRQHTVTLCPYYQPCVDRLESTFT